jgi:PAT family beta-lactamase induction signal transducer AmpG
LWVFGILQVFSNLGYFLLSRLPAPNIPFMYGAAGFELFTSGLGTGAFSVLLIRLTQKRFSATQYALFSSLFALPRVLAGPISGFAVDAVGWSTFFLSTMVLGIPGLMMLSRFVPIGVREPEFTVEEIPRTRIPTSSSSLAVRGIAAGLFVGVGSAALIAFLDALKTMRDMPRFVAAFARVGHPVGAADWLQLLGIVLFAAIVGLFVAAALAAKRGIVGVMQPEAPDEATGVARQNA